MQQIQVSKGEVGVAGGIAFLEQVDIHGVTNTIIVSSKQLGEIAWFLAHPDSRRFRSTHHILGTVNVIYSSADERYTVEQGELKLVGNRDSQNYGFSDVVELKNKMSSSAAE